MRLWFCLIWFCLCSGTFPSCAANAEDSPVPKIVGFPKEGRLEADGSGRYAALVRAIMEEANHNAPFITVPVKRALRFFETEGNVCMVPVSLLAVSLQFPAIPAEKLIESRPIDYITAHLITPTGSSPIRDPKDIEGKTVAAWVGVKMKLFFPNINFTVLKTESEESAIRLLHSGRADLMWGWIPDAYILYDEMGLGTPVMAVDKPVFASTAHFVCHRTPESEALMPKINNVIDRMRADGRLKEILSKYARIVGVDVPEKTGKQTRNMH